MSKPFEDLNLEAMAVCNARNANGSRENGVWLPGKKVAVHLADGMVENFHLKRPRRVEDFLVSILAHSFVVALLILLPLLYINAVDLPQFERTLLVAPPPPPPPPAPRAPRVIEHRPPSFFLEGKLLAPRFIPKKVALEKEEAPPTLTAGGGTGGVPGGVPGGTMGGVLGGILGQGYPLPAPPTPVGHKGPYRVGGQVRAPELLEQVDPIYPAIAKEARVQGDVVLESVIDPQGNVTQMRLVSGSALLVRAAMQAVEQWKYRPTLLNGRPVAIDMLVTVHFVLADPSQPS